MQDTQGGEGSKVGGSGQRLTWGQEVRDSLK